MSTQQHKAQTFRSLHQPGRPLVLFNIWDVGSAKAVAAAGAPAIATGSWAVAAANGFADGEQMPLSFALANLSRIVAATALPVTIDLESGYGASAADVGASIAQAIAAGAIGCNLEDSFPADGSLRGIDEQVQRYVQARAAATAASVDLFINARTDVFFQRPPEAHDAAMLAQAVARAQAYAAAGADGLFVPGLADEALIAQLVDASPLPVNIMVGATTPSLEKLAALGVARISHGPGPYLAAMKSLQQSATQVGG
ncbi:2-methylisocitrate lyase-like PEP mutase family enzyme [Tahibacter aquaticus]|uniref:2-methylisocitrate lyase-like PEP mutase family enzyme n=1 Tax=Tahibacter aquaticus TaxID=520092 RepID=A0A4R6YTB4_9GAMM|nr:isocitrate lyase/phosphoenolpyruvate mutase family protein [Tahibacter aquaticus]TDR41524.1 2-methylisocitrate lyase-like PEP mutase family enzyme [Tahibacter aquaticus]